MDRQATFDFTYSQDLSNEAAYEIAAFLQALSISFEGNYFGQIIQHQREIYPLESDLVKPPPWHDDDDDPTF